MGRKILSVSLSLALLDLTPSCVVHRTRQQTPAELSHDLRANLPIVRVLMKSGQMLDFSAEVTAHLAGDAIARSMKVKTDGVLKVSRDGDSFVLTTGTGRNYRTKSYHQAASDQLVIDLEAIPVSDVAMVWTREVNSGLSVLATVGGFAAVWGTLVIIYVSSPGRAFCPLLYSYDGSRYSLEGELYSGAVFRDVERSDVLKLHHLAPQANEYVVKIANEADETQYTDEATLLIVDHPPDVDVYAGVDGRVRTVRRPAIAPLSAADFDGVAFTETVSTVDETMWSGNPFDKDPEDPSHWTSGLVLRFSKPPTATTAKLVVRIGNTYWADTVLARFLGLMGSAWPAWYQSVERGYFHPTGPFGVKDDILELDLSDVPGDLLTVRLRGGTFFWAVDAVAIDYSRDVPVRVHALTPRTAVDDSGRDVRAELSASDKSYFAMPEPGRFALVRYAAPAVDPGLSRSFLLRSWGYYTLHATDATTAPDLATLLAIRQRPELFLKYSLVELQKTARPRPGSARPVTSRNDEARP
jgi:hypothetical protein